MRIITMNSGGSLTLKNATITDGNITDRGGRCAHIVPVPPLQLVYRGQSQ